MVQQESRLFSPLFEGLEKLARLLRKLLLSVTAVAKQAHKHVVVGPDVTRRHGCKFLCEALECESIKLERAFLCAAFLSDCGSLKHLPAVET